MKKPSLAVIIASGKKRPDDEDEGDGDFAAASDELANIVGVGEEERDAFRDALEACIRACK